MDATSTSLNKRVPNPVLTKIIGCPTYRTIHIIHMELNANATTVPSNLSNHGNGTLGHLRLVVNATTYSTRSGGTVFVEPANPGTQAPRANGATQIQITEDNRRYDRDTIEYALYNSTGDILKHQLLQAVEDVYTKALKERDMGYGRVPVLSLLEHLDTHYGTIADDELLANSANLHAEWHPPTPIEDLFERIDECIAFAEAGEDRISNRTAITAGIAVITKTGLFTAPLREWEQRLPANKTLTHFKAFFIDAEQKRRKQATAQDSGYHGAHAAIITDLQAQLATALAMATEAKALAAAATNQANRNNRNRNNNNNNNNNNNTNNNPPPGNGGHNGGNNGNNPNGGNQDNRTPREPRPTGYCWTHGITRNGNHNSPNCRNPAEGHQCEATAANMMGGNPNGGNNRN